VTTEVAWWSTAVIYCVNVKTFQDSDGDGIGDLAGLTGRLPYLAELGVTCLWLQPLYPSPWHDDGYDISDYTAVDPRLGTLTDFDRMIDAARALGIRVLLDLSVNHTSTEHSWFQQARRDPASPYRDWYIFSPDSPDWPTHLEFPEESPSNWTLDEQAGAYYLHRYYETQADLRFANPDVRRELQRIMWFWLDRGVAGFRLDTVPWLVETAVALRADGDPGHWLAELCEAARHRRPDVLLLGEINGTVEEQLQYFGSPRRMLDMILNFDLNRNVWLALAVQRAPALTKSLARLRRPWSGSQWANFLRNHDELNIDGLSDDERAAFFTRFPPDTDGPIYGRGVRRRVPPLLGDRRRVESAYSLLFALPGTPVMMYGEEVGMGDNLALPMRFSVRTPMQWSAGHNGGFSVAPTERLVRPMVSDPAYAHQAVNVVDQLADPASLLSWFRRLIAARHACPELGAGAYTALPVAEPALVAFRCSWRDRLVVCVHNLGDRDAELKLDEGLSGGDRPFREVWSDRAYAAVRSGDIVPVTGHGYRWLRSD
jgi:maltose alpha-D-glucosyltransferase / alpha-amylase